ncbi:hypothetical protein C1646_812924 [Rhizophagus diaphanus]|nr:hypothetical protein C1646_812924 [Rhizophagus diaphanus] [Rhizophagus sp. MUCL 43196]
MSTLYHIWVCLKNKENQLEFEIFKSSINKVLGERVEEREKEKMTNFREKMLNVASDKSFIMMQEGILRELTRGLVNEKWWNLCKKKDDKSIIKEIFDEYLLNIQKKMDSYYNDNGYVYENDAENHMPSPDNNMENEFYEDEPEDSLLKEIYSGQTFTSFEILEQSLKRYASQKGFEIRITYKCHHGGKYIPKKQVDPTQTRDRESIRIECGFLVNASYRKCQNLVFVNKFVNEHNHELQNGIDLQEFSPLLRKIPDNIIEEIQFYVQECHLVFENLLQQFIEQQTLSLSAQNDDLTEEVLDISNPIQHKGKGRPANKRYLSVIENRSNRNANSRNQDQDEVSKGSKKRNKWQCALCKSWYHDSRNCPSKNKEHSRGFLSDQRTKISVDKAPLVTQLFLYLQHHLILLLF